MEATTFLRLFHTKKFSPILLSLLLTLSALGAIIPVALAEAVVAIEPVTSVADPPASFSINVTISGVFDLYSYELKVGFDKNVLTPTNALEGPFLITNPGAPFGTLFSYQLNDNFVYVACVTVGFGEEVYGATGSGTLAILEFTVEAPGESNLDIYDSLLLDYFGSGTEIPHTTSDGFFHSTLPAASFTFVPDPSVPGMFGRPIVGENVTFDALGSYDPDGGSIVAYIWDFNDTTTGTGAVVKHIYDESSTLTRPYNVTLTVIDDEDTNHTTWRTISVKLHDITVADITGPDEIFVHRIAEFNVTVVNNGSHSDSFNTTLYYNSNPIGTQSSIEVNPDDNDTLTFRWNTFINQTTVLANNRGTGTWSYPLNATTSDDLYTYSSIPAAVQELLGYNTTTAGWAGIFRVEVGIEAKTEAGGDDQISVQVYTGRTWSPEYVSNITSTDDTFRWIDVTGTLSWLPAMVQEGNVRARIKYIQVGGTATPIYVDWLPIRITPTNPTDIPEGVYAIWANAFLVDHVSRDFRPNEESNTTDNTLMGKSIAVTLIPSHDIAVTIEEVDPTQVAVGRTSTVTAKVENLGNVDEIVDVFVYNNGIQVANQTNLRLTAGNFRRVTLTWFTASNTTVEGNYNVTVYVPPATDEVLTANNMHDVMVLMKLLPVAYFTFSPASPQISEAVQFDASPSYAPGEPGGLITDYLWDFGDGATGTGATVTHAFTQPGSWSVELTVIDDEDLNSTGSRVVPVPKLASTITIASSLTPVPLGLNTTVSGSISPVRANVNVKINSTRIDDSVTTTIANLTSNQQGQYSFVWVPDAIGAYRLMAFWPGDDVTAGAQSSMLNVTVVLQDLVLVKVDLSKILVAPGGSVQIDVTVMNKGSEKATFDVNVYYNDTLLEAKSVTDLLAGDSRELSFDWDTTDIDEGVYLIKATAVPMQGESNAADNSITTGMVVGSAGGVSEGMNIFMYTTIALVVVIAAMAIYMFRMMRTKGKEHGQQQNSQKD